MKKDGGSEYTIISKFVLVYALHSLEYVLGLARFRVFVPNIYIYMAISLLNFYHLSNLVHSRKLAYSRFIRFILQKPQHIGDFYRNANFILNLLYGYFVDKCLPFITKQSHLRKLTFFRLKQTFVENSNSKGTL